MKIPFLSTPLAIFVLAAWPAPLQAAPEVVDFVPLGAGAYLLGARTLVGQDPFLDGFSGPWLAAYPGAESPGVSGGGLSFPGVPGAEGSFFFPGTGNGRAGRLLTRPITDTSSGTLYLSVLIQLQSVGSAYRAFELHSGGFDDDTQRSVQLATGEPGGLGLDPTHFVARVKDGANVVAGDLGAGNLTANLFVARADLSAEPGADSLTIWRNPEPSVEPAGGAIVFSNLNLRFDRLSLARFGSDGIFFDEIRIGPTWADVTTFDHIANDDTDLDGLRDGWERFHGLVVGSDDSALDSDGDSLTNADEFALGTKPRDSDTDDDGLSDGVERLSGFWTSRATDTGTDPLNPDSDRDGLRDGVENPDLPYSRANPAGQPGSDPNQPDTDGDGEGDGLEISNGTDPTDPASTSASLRVVVIDGRWDAGYGAALAVQTIETGFGNNFSEWNAAYGKVIDGQLNLLFTGNLEANFNKLEIFLDSLPGGSNVLPGLPGNDNAGALFGMVLDAAFTPEFHLIARRGNNKFDLDFSRLGTTSADSYRNILNAGASGTGSTGTGTVNRSAIAVAYDGSNTAGIGGSAGSPANQAAARAVTTGLELRIDLADLGNPAGGLRVMLLQNNQNHTFLSNQALGGLPVGTGNLANPATTNFNLLAGDQFFTVTIPAPRVRLLLDMRSLTAGQLQVTVGNIPPGRSFHFRRSVDGQAFTPLIPAVTFDASTPQPIAIPVTGASLLIQAWEGAAP